MKSLNLLWKHWLPIIEYLLSRNSYECPKMDFFSWILARSKWIVCDRLFTWIFLREGSWWVWSLPVVSQPGSLWFASQSESSASQQNTFFCPSFLLGKSASSPRKSLSLTVRHTATKIQFIYSKKRNCAASVPIPHSCVCERFIFSQDRPTYFPAAELPDRL
jgi:hypothetical protein